MPYSLLLCLLVLSPSGPNNPRRRPSLDIPRPPETCPNPAFRCLVADGRSENGTGAQKPPKNAPSVMDVPVQLPVTRRATPIKTLSRLSSPKIRSNIRSHVSSLTSSSFLAPNTSLRRTTSNRPDALNRKRTGIPNDPSSPSPCSIPPERPNIIGSQQTGTNANPEQKELASASTLFKPSPRRAHTRPRNRDESVP